MGNSKKRVLIVDDDEEFLAEVTETLQLSGYESIPISEGHRVANEAKEIMPDVILLDLKMDAVSGFKVANELGDQEETKDIPIIAVTGVFTESEHRLLMKTCGIRECVTKPFNPLDIINIIEKFI